MADGITINTAGGGTALVESDDIAGRHHQKFKVEWGADNTVNETDDATGKRFPVKVGDPLPAGTAVIGTRSRLGCSRCSCRKCCHSRYWSSRSRRLLR